MKKYFFAVLLVFMSIFAVSCEDTDDPIDTRVTLLDLVGKTEEEIETLYESVELTILFIYVETNDVNPGLFIRYRGGYLAGNQVASGTEIRIEIAKAIDNSFILLNLAGNTQAQINALYQDVDLILVFETLETNSIPAGRFVNYVGHEAGDSVELGSTITIIIAIAEEIVNTDITLLDLIGKTEAEIINLYENSELTIVFVTVETNNVNPGLFIKYRDYHAGNQVPSGTTITIEIAIAKDNRIELLDLTSKTQAQIILAYQSIQVTLVFQTLQTNSITAGRFVEYADYEIGDLVEPGSTIIVLLATPIRIELLDLSGLSQSEIELIYENDQINLIFQTVQTNAVPSGQFVAYIDRQIGDFVGVDAEIVIQIAIRVLSAPLIVGADDVDVFVSVAGNPPTFDLQEGVQAFDYLGNEIPFGGFFFILKIEDSQGNPLTQIDYYRIGVYTVFYRAINSQLLTTVERRISIVIPPFDTNHTDNLRLSEEYVGKSFIQDGIGQVVVTTFTDGDTTNFMDLKTGIRFTVRYLGIDTPEATSKYDPWGIKAGNFVREKLTNAEKIILQSEGPVTTDGNGRYLAWVWYVENGQTRLLNLELVEQAYGWVSGASSTQYGNIFSVAGAETQLTGRRIYGEIDPDYDYSSDGIPVEIGYLLDNFDEYLSRKVIITGIITSKVGNSIYIEQDERGIFIFTGYNLTNELQIGHEVTIQGLVAAVYFNSKQLSNYKYENMKLESTDNVVPITTIMGNQISSYVGRVVNFENLTITSIYQSPTNNAYNVYAVDNLGNEVNIRIDDYTASFVPRSLFIVGKQISVFGPVSQFDTNYQVMLPGLGNIVFKD
jgi:endonuclease YncB( thermonuclease family)